MDFRSATHLNRFIRAVEWSRRRLAPFCRNRTEILRLLAGSRYGENCLPLSQPIPFLQLLHSVYVRSLISSSPRAMISTRVQSLKPVAHAMQIAVNAEVEQMGLAKSLRTLVSDALCGIGVMKVGVCWYPRPGTEGLLHDYMQPYADAISLDDAVWDMAAKRDDQIGYAGNHYRVPRESLLQDPRYPHDRVLRLVKSELHARSEMGEDLASSISGEENNFDADHEDMIDLWEFWIPRDNAIMVMTSERGRLVDEPLYVADYIGPRLGPYHFLRYNPINDNSMPAPPLFHLADGHEALNGIYRKLLSQALRQKNIIPVPGGREDDMRKFNQTPDGHGVGVDTPDIKELRLGGIDQQNAGFALQLKGDLSYFAGNLEAIAGLGTSSDTLGQDRLITQSASKQVQAMQEETVIFTKQIMETLVEYWWKDNNRTYEAEFQIPKTDITHRATVTPEERAGWWPKLNFQVDPYSFQSDTPQSMIQKIMQLLTQVLIPLQPVMQQQGAAINVAGVSRLFAKYNNMPDLEEMVSFTEPNFEDQELQEPPRMPQNTTRTYERVNRPGATNQGKDLALMQTYAGKPPQPAEQAGMMRPTG